MRLTTLCVFAEPESVLRAERVPGPRSVPQAWLRLLLPAVRDCAHFLCTVPGDRVRTSRANPTCLCVAVAGAILRPTSVLVRVYRVLHDTPVLLACGTYLLSHTQLHQVQAVRSARPEGRRSHGHERSSAVVEGRKGCR